MNTYTGSSSDAGVATSVEGDLRRYLRGLGGLLAFLLVWWLGAVMTQPSYLVPGPLDSARAFIDLFATSTAIVVPNRSMNARTESSGPGTRYDGRVITAPTHHTSRNTRSQIGRAHV